MAAFQDWSTSELMMAICSVDRTASLGLQTSGEFFLDSNIRIKGEHVEKSVEAMHKDPTQAVGLIFDELTANTLVVDRNNVRLYYRWNGIGFALHSVALDGNII